MVSGMTRRSVWLNVIMLMASCMLSACQHPGTEQVASGSVVSVGEENIILLDGASYLFVSLHDIDKERVQCLKKGEQVTLLGHKEMDAQQKETSEIDEIVAQDGKHIPLGDH